jgi:hypothetical protein
MSQDDERTINSFSKALALIDEVRKAKNAEIKSQEGLLIWRCAAELEYLAFLIAINYGLNDFIPKIDKSLLVSVDTAHDLVENARVLLQSDPRLAYAKIRQSVGIMRALSTDQGRPRKVLPH